MRGTAAVTTGNRWFFPDRPTPGSMCRFYWNASVVPQMALHHMPWGGTMAVRRDLIEDERLRDHIRQACSEDTSIGQFAYEQGERVHFEPSLLIVNREEIGLHSFFEFETRQLLFTRLEFHAYGKMTLFGLLSVTLPVYPLARLCGLSVSGWADGAFLAYFLANWAGMLSLGLTIRHHILARRSERLAGWDGRRWLYSLLAAFLLPLLHLGAVLRAALMRRVRWRGVWYRIGGRPKLQVERDEWDEWNSSSPAGLSFTTADDRRASVRCPPSPNGDREDIQPVSGIRQRIGSLDIGAIVSHAGFPRGIGQVVRLVADRGRRLRGLVSRPSDLWRGPSSLR